MKVKSKILKFDNKVNDVAIMFKRLPDRSKPHFLRY